MSRLVEEAERLYGMANYTYTEYIVERLEICLTTCSNLLQTIQRANSQLEEDYKVSLQELNDCLRLLHSCSMNVTLNQLHKISHSYYIHNTQLSVVNQSMHILVVV